MSAPVRPNILLIIADQHRADCVEGAGHPLVRTPALLRLAREGVHFTHAFTPVPCCAPARQSLLCGEWPQSHGGLWNYGVGFPLPLFDRSTWSEALLAAGYRTAYVGKWGVHPSRSPLDFGFQEYISSREYDTWRAAQGLSRPMPLLASSLPENAPVSRWFGGADPASLGSTRTHWCARQAIGLLERYACQERVSGGQSPWCLVLAFEEPHLPPYPADRFAEMYPPGTIPPWGSFGDPLLNKPYIQRQQLASWGVERLGWEEWSLFVSRYLGMISQIDDAVGQVLRALDALGLADSTLVIYTSDHGDNCGSHGMVDKHYIMYDDVVRVPLLLRWPDAFSKGRVCDAMVIHALDLAATIYDVATLEQPEHGAGRSLLPLCRGEEVADWREEAIAVANGAQFGLYCQRMLRDRHFKYVWNATDVDELYDLATDPWELYNLAAEAAYQGCMQHMRRRLLQALEAQGDALVRNEWMRAQLIQGRKFPR